MSWQNHRLIWVQVNILWPKPQAKKLFDNLKLFCYNQTIEFRKDHMSNENNNQKQPPTNPWGPWAQYQEEQTKLWLNYWTGVMNSLFNTDLKK
jgi:hypothetical protein